MLERRFLPPRPVITGAPPQGLAVLRAFRTNVLKLWRDEAYECDAQLHSFLGRRVMLLNAPDAIHRVLVENEENYRRSPLRVRLLRPVVGNGLLLSEGQAWRHQRRTAAPAFTPRGLPILMPHIAAALQEGVASLAALKEPLVDIFETVQRWAADISGRSMFSLEMATYGAEMRRLARYYVRRLARPYLLDAVLPLDLKSPHDYARARFSKRWMGLLERMIARRLAVPDTDAPRDLLDLLREARDAETGNGFSREQLRDQVATMLVAGHETTSVAMFWSLYLLASVPFVQESVADEVRHLDLSPARAADSLSRLPYTRAVISEALRLYPPAFMIVREAIGADRCGTSEVPKGATVLIAPWVLGRHRRYWYDPHAFDPERFTAGAPAVPRFAYLPFGVGPRVCIGAQFAMAMAVIVVAGLVQRFRLHLVDSTPAMPVCVITTRPDRPPRFRLLPR